MVATVAAAEAAAVAAVAAAAEGRAQRVAVMMLLAGGRCGTMQSWMVAMSFSLTEPTRHLGFSRPEAASGRARALHTAGF